MRAPMLFALPLDLLPPGPGAGAGSSGGYSMAAVAESPHEHGATFLPPKSAKPNGPVGAPFFVCIVPSCRKMAPL